MLLKLSEIMAQREGASQFGHVALFFKEFESLVLFLHKRAKTL